MYDLNVIKVSMICQFRRTIHESTECLIIDLKIDQLYLNERQVAEYRTDALKVQNVIRENNTFRPYLPVPAFLCID